MNDHTMTYDPNPAGSLPITRCSCGWISKSGNELHLISPHAISFIASHGIELARLRAEVERLMAVVRAAERHTCNQGTENCEICKALAAFRGRA